MHKRFFKYVLGILALLTVTVTLSACSVNPPKYNPHESVGPQVHYTITGIDAGAGSMASAARAIPAYGLNKENWQLQPSSDAAMCSELGKSIKYHQAIVIVAWQPHWIFKQYPIKFLKDPKHVFGTGEQIKTVARKGLEKDNPGAYKLLSQFHWNQQLMSDTMYENYKGESPVKTAKEFIRKHPKQVKQYLKGVPDGHGKPVKLAYVTWDDSTASANVVTQLLKMKGYDATCTAMEGQPVWQSIAKGSMDATTGAWLPVTQAPMYNKYKSQVKVVRTNCPGAKVGLAVPKYMKNVNTIDDLKNK